ncbi:MAG: hypothetical protein WBD40_22845 [Tepidisphaeraceae bacterium]
MSVHAVLTRLRSYWEQPLAARFQSVMVTVGIVLAAAGLLLTLINWAGTQEDILRMAYSISDAGGYCDLEDTGVSEAVVHDGLTILPASRGGSYCCGFTFMVAMRVATERGLMDGKEPYEVKRFQREWYGSTKASRDRQVALAVEQLGIGREVDRTDARPGDFVAFQRIGAGGHSVVFLRWIRRDGEIIGFRYRSSQPFTDGVGDCNEYFVTSGYEGAFVDPAHFYVARLN